MNFDRQIVLGEFSWCEVTPRDTQWSTRSRDDGWLAARVWWLASASRLHIPPMKSGRTPPVTKIPLIQLISPNTIVQAMLWSIYYIDRLWYSIIDEVNMNVLQYIYSFFPARSMQLMQRLRTCTRRFSCGILSFWSSCKRILPWCVPFATGQCQCSCSPAPTLFSIWERSQPLAEVLFVC